MFETDAFMPRTHCGPGWTSSLIAINQYSNIGIAIAYLILSLTLLFIYYKRRHFFLKSWILLFFASFIALCGVTHLNDYFAFTWPAYRFFTLIDFLTALISLITAIIFPFVVIILMRIKPIKILMQMTEILHDENASLSKRELECTRINTQLHLRIKGLEDELHKRDWIDEKYKVLKQMKQALENEK